MAPAIFLRLINGFFFYLVWAICIWAVLQDTAWKGVICVVSVLIFHLLTTKRFLLELSLMISLSLFGLLIESSFLNFGIISYKGVNLPWLAPLWVVSLHATFSTSINGSLFYFAKYPKVAALLGGIGTAVCYYTASKVSVITLRLPYVSFVIIALVWSFYFPFVFYYNSFLMKRLEKK